MKIKPFLTPLLALLIYFLVQVICSLLLPIISLVTNDNTTTLPTVIDGSSLSWLLLASSVITIVVFHFLKYIDIAHPRGVQPHCSWRTLLFAILPLTLLMFASNLLTEWMNLDNIMEEQFLSMATTIPGILAIGIIGPITEEYVFREAIQGSMLRNGVSPVIACIVSALVFGIIHANPAQIPFAFLVGLAFAYVYLRTRSVIPVMICHIINNSSAVILMNVYADRPDLGFSDLLGTTMMIVCFVVSLTLGLILLKRI